MKKRLIALGMALLLCLGFAPDAFALEGLQDDGYFYFTDRSGNEMKAPADAFATRMVSFIPGDPWTDYEHDKDPNTVLGLPDYVEDGEKPDNLCMGAGGVLVLEFDVAIYDGEGLDIYVFEVGPDVEATEVEVSSDLSTWYDVGTAQGRTAGVDLAGKVPEGGRFRYVRLTDLKESIHTGWPGADLDAISGLNVKAITSDWASPEVDRAEELGLIPDILRHKNMTESITREEFAAVSVKVYESLTGLQAIPVVNNPFTDTKNVEVLKAYNLYVVNGVSPTRFQPDGLLNREQAAVMLTRVFKRITLTGWTLDTDSQFKLDYTMPAPFADDKEISNYARDSVYFMAANDIIKGKANNIFAPQNKTTAQEAEGYANATREQALAIAVRMVEKGL